MKRILNRYKRIIIYGLISVFVTLVDVLISYAFEIIISPVYANTIGVVSGFILQYFLASKSVFNSRNIRTFIIFLGTFFIGLLCADVIIYICRNYIFADFSQNIAFIISKGFSILIPFFLMYFLRKWLIKSDKDNADV